jgi:hypothetical protein
MIDTLPRTSVAIALLAMTGAIAGLAYFHANRSDSGAPEQTMSVASRPAAPARSSGERPANISPAAPVAQSGSPPQDAVQNAGTDNVARWIAGTRDTDPRTRAAAIAALAEAPKAQALPALSRVLESGEAQVDRQIALRSLYTLALNDRDEDGVIRDAIRHAIYHSDDEGVAQSAQALLEDIEAAFAER